MSDQRPLERVARRRQDLYRGSLLGGAVGDALGAPVEFMSRSEITRKFGQGGIQEYALAFGKFGAITDDTQMTLFTAEGLLRAWVGGNLRELNDAQSAIGFAYQRWFHTQGQSHPLHKHCLDGWLIGHRELFSRRAPGNTCLSGLNNMKTVTNLASNDSKGCGGVMRVAPIGMFYATLASDDAENQAALLREAFDLASKAAAITHGHPTGQLASGAFAAVIMQVLLGLSLPRAIETVMPLLAEQPNHEETTAAIQAASRLAIDMPNDAEALTQLGGGWVAEEALAIALYCALSVADFRAGVVLAVNHGGDSDSTGSMAGQLLGAMYGVQDIPGTWVEPLELRGVIEDIADDLCAFEDWRLKEDVATKDAVSCIKRYSGS